jgi:ABC-type transport system substrate-binding protein
MKYKTKLTVYFAVILMCVSLMAFAGGGQDVQEQTNDELTVALSAGITSLDPQGHNDTKSEKVSFLVFNRLFKLNTDFKVVPDLAESWELNPLMLLINILSKLLLTLHLLLFYTHWFMPEHLYFQRHILSQEMSLLIR